MAAIFYTPAYAAFIDLNKAFDYVDHSFLI